MSLTPPDPAGLMPLMNIVSQVSPSHTPSAVWVNPARTGHHIIKEASRTTLFTHKQHEELEAAFSQIKKNLQKAHPLKLNLREITVRVWLQDTWVKLIKEQR